ncbi:MAG: DNA repair protein RecO [Deltaproteobacteria bacterium]|jgi:DNA repair protein RecO (recombination protein O)|nr:DNA repair protein RecO [Deltaproteobacteria bacterium]
MIKKTRRPRLASPERRLAAVVLSRANSGEADLVVTFLTRELGLLTALAKNARRSVKRFGGGLLSPARAAWYDFRVSPYSDLAFVARGENNPDFPLLPPEPLALALGSWAVELTRSLEAPRNPAPLTFNLLVRHLVRLARCPDFTPPALEARRLSLGFTKCYLEVAGFGPSLLACHQCGRKPETGDWAWSPSQGVVLCPDCRSLQAELVPGELIQALGGIHDHLAGPRLNPESLARAEGFLARMASLAADRAYRSRRVIQQLLRDPPPPGPLAPLPLAQGRPEFLAPRTISEVLGGES